MKRRNVIVNRRAWRVGRRMARWASSGMHWGEPTASRVSEMGRAALAEGPARLAALGQRFLQIDAAERRAGIAGDGSPASCWWQTGAVEVLEAHLGCGTIKS